MLHCIAFTSCRLPSPSHPSQILLTWTYIEVNFPRSSSIVHIPPDILLLYILLGDPSICLCSVAYHGCLYLQPDPSILK